MKNLYFRIGSDKAGTVSIANLVEDNHDVFLKHNIYAPFRNCVAFLDRIDQRSKHRVKGFEHEAFERKYSEQINDLEKNYAQYKDHNIFLTTESVWGRLPWRRFSKRQTHAFLSTFKDFFHHHHIKIILHLRRADLYYESLLKQAVKSGQANSMDFIKKFRTLRSAKKAFHFFKMLEDVFGRDNIILKPFERDQFEKRDLIIDLLKIMEIDHAHQDFQISIGNESMQRDLLETVAILNKQNGKLLDNKNLNALSKILIEDKGFFNGPKNAFDQGKIFNQRLEG